MTGYRDRKSQYSETDIAVKNSILGNIELVEPADYSHLMLQTDDHC